MNDKQNSVYLVLDTGNYETYFVETISQVEDWHKDVSVWEINAEKQTLQFIIDFLRYIADEHLYPAVFLEYAKKYLKQVKINE